MSQGVIQPGGCIGIIGAGQLGKMTAMEAARLGYQTVVWAPKYEPAFDVATYRVLAKYDDLDACAQFVSAVDVVTLEWENIPTHLIARLAQYKPVRPSAKVLAVTQDRWHEKELFRLLGIPAAHTVAIDLDVDEETLAKTLESFSYPGILKTRRDGYDGKGQERVASVEDVLEAFNKFERVPCVLEEVVNFIAEGSVMVARNPNGECVTSPVLENKHRGGILRETTWPPRHSRLQDMDSFARDIAKKIARELELEGIMGVEFFFTEDNVYANELAPRPHNSGHGLTEACATSQFEQHVRAICNLPLGSMEPHSSFVMTNLIGNDMLRVPDILQDPGATLHIYNKGERREGRKMGHYTKLFPLNK